MNRCIGRQPLIAKGWPCARRAKDDETCSIVQFEIIFVATDSVRYHYHCAVSPDRVHREWMVAYPNGRPQRWFEREYDSRTKRYEWWFGPNFKGERAERKVWQDFTRDNALFFSTAIQLNNAQLKPAFAWFTQKLIVLSADTSWNRSFSLKLLRQKTGQAKLMSYMRAADIGIDRLELLEEDSLPASTRKAALSLFSTSDSLPLDPKRVRVRTWRQQVDTEESVSLDMQDESDGTRQLFALAGGWIQALERGATLFVDELDRSLHPHMTRFLVELFHGSTNPEGAQLIYTTHDTTLLNTDLLRRDQVWFIEKNDHQATRVFSLLEYRPRKDEALERGYLKGRYGAVPSIGNLPN